MHKTVLHAETQVHGGEQILILLPYFLSGDSQKGSKFANYHFLVQREIVAYHLHQE